ncbi:uncharacterized protein LOC111708695 isoform X2 [Eurytemora carolleeae]|uniref:uncharacterized protein LOC111708695 isoform X2 n=1 Tax=Eurytemora carolleeae TaxID=1294199 RepID=UPI000C7899DC|nr:uncharacterized protein LOC111708695 isoform X2 [Eurytemora carolleeae]|eukprot:XP_023337917.1 uncharacterized protein LOC111708695 isoform X2 [Eurytemora affinis]
MDFLMHNVVFISTIIFLTLLLNNQSYCKSGVHSKNYVLAKLKNKTNFLLELQTHGVKLDKKTRNRPEKKKEEVSQVSGSDYSFDDGDDETEDNDDYDRNKEENGDKDNDDGNEEREKDDEEGDNKVDQEDKEGENKEDKEGKEDNEDGEDKEDVEIENDGRELSYDVDFGNPADNMERDEYYFLFGRTDLDFGNLKKDYDDLPKCSGYCGCFKYPENCKEEEECEYSVTWKRKKGGIQFTIATKGWSERWFGIGLGYRSSHLQEKVRLVTGVDIISGPGVVTALVEPKFLYTGQNYKQAKVKPIKNREEFFNGDDAELLYDRNAAHDIKTMSIRFTIALDSIGPGGKARIHYLFPNPGFEAKKDISEIYLNPPEKKPWTYRTRFDFNRC